MPDSRPRPAERVWVDVDGVAVHARHAGPRTTDPAAPPPPVIVLVHGLGMSSRYMMPLLLALAPQAEVYAPDLPGYGRSQNPPTELRLNQLADSLAHWMAAMGLGPAVVAGNSLGAQIVAHLAVRYPAQVQRAVFIGATRDPHSGGPWQHLIRLILDALRERPSLLWVAATDYLRAGPRRMFRLLREALEVPEEAELVRISMPTLVARGSRDPISTQPWNEEITRLIPQAQLRVVEGTAHAVNYSAPAPLARLILDFCAQPPRQP